MSAYAKLAAEYAVKFVEDGMKIGLGSGTTVYWTILKLGELVKQGMDIKGIPTSLKTEAIAKDVGIPLIDFSHTQKLDLTIDGTKQIDPHLNMIKGGGGSFFREKIVAHASERVIIVADRSKQVTVLGAYPVPVEVHPFAWQYTVSLLEQFGCQVTMRMKDDSMIMTDNDHYIADCLFDKIDDPASLDKELKLVPGVIETGIFCELAHLFITTDNKGMITMVE